MNALLSEMNALLSEMNALLSEMNALLSENFFQKNLVNHCQKRVYKIGDFCATYITTYFTSDDEGHHRFFKKGEEMKIVKDEQDDIQAMEGCAAIIARSELNLEHNSVFTVSTYKERYREVFAKKIGPDGVIYKIRAIIGKTEDGKEVGVLTTYDFKVYLVLLKFWEEAGQPVNELINFTIRDVIEGLGMVNSGANYRRVKKHLAHLRQIPITFIESFYIKNEGEYTDLAYMSILNHLDIYERRRQDGSARPRGVCKFRFDQHILDNLIGNHSHPLRLDVIITLDEYEELAILLYAYLDRNLAFRDTYEIRLEKLFEHLGLSQEYVRFPSDRKAKIEPVIKKLYGKELSTGVLSLIEIKRTSDGAGYKLICGKSPFISKLSEALTLDDVKCYEPDAYNKQESESNLFSMLVEAGLTAKQAGKLILEKPLKVVKAQLEYLPFRVGGYKAQNKKINEAAILFDSIMYEWQPPEGYVRAEEEIEKKARRVEEEMREAQLQAAAERMGKEVAEMKIFKENLPSKERESLRNEALVRIGKMEGIRKEFVSDILIGAIENEILKARRMFPDQ